MTGPAPQRAQWRGSGTGLRVLLLVAVALVCGSAGPVPLRIALVIGNAAYQFNDGLPNARSDAERVADRVRRLGFEVVPGTVDLDRRHLGPVIEAFGNRLRAAGPNVISFIYYAGHAAQDASGTNYLLPVDAQASSPAQLRQVAVPVQPLLRFMSDSNNAVNILVLDACRDWFKGDRSIPRRGLHDMGEPPSVLIAYATAADQTASEGEGESSPFSRRLIEALDQRPTTPVALLFDDIQTNVYADTDSAQSPQYFNGLVRAGRWSFATAEAAATASTPRLPSTNAPVNAFLAGLSRDRLLTLTRGKESFVDALLAHRDVLAANRIDTPNRLAYFLGAVGFETAGFRPLIENFGYSAARLQKTWPGKVPSAAVAATVVGRPEAVANLVYSGLNGNGDVASGDGWRYRGRGLFFLTGRNWYARYSARVGVDLLSYPDLLNDPNLGIAVAAAFWADRKANEAADRDDLTAVARAVRFGTGQLPARAVWVRLAKTAVAG